MNPPRGNFSPSMDVYVHHFSCDLVGDRSEKGQYQVIEREGLLGIVEADGSQEGDDDRSGTNHPFPGDSVGRAR